MRRNSLRPPATSAFSRTALTLLALLFAFAAWPVAVQAAEGAPKKKDSPAVFRPKEITLTPSVKPVEARAGEVVTYRVEARLEPGWHVYKYVKGSTELRDTTFDAFGLDGLQAEGDWKASRDPVKKRDPAVGEVLEFYENDVTWSLSLKIPAGTAAGKKKVRVQAHYQICDASSCKIPGQWTLADVEVTVLPGGAPAAAIGTSPADAVVATTSEAPAQAAKAAAPPAPAVTAAPATSSSDSGPISEVAQKAKGGLLGFLLFSASGGLLALVMPCVWPMIPITVNFFVKQGQKNKGKTTGLAIAYCLAIIGVFTSFGVLVSFFFSATALQSLAANPWLNAAVAALFVAFGLSLLGVFEIRLPNFLLNASSRGESKGGLVGVMFMALTLTITSFTCTFPVVGGLIVMAAGGEFFYPIIGLATFSAVLAFPFLLLALAPGLLSKMPRSGDWMNTVKVVGGLVEMGAALKFINTAEIGFGTVPEDAWFDASLVLSVWVGLAVVCGVYLLGLFRTDHDNDDARVGPGRLIVGSSFLALALFLAPALFGRPPQSPLWSLLVGILPPDVNELTTPAARTGGGGGEGGGAIAARSADPDQAQREEKSFHGVVWGMSYEAALEEARRQNKPVLVDFTGVYCTNCRTMELGVMPRKEIVALLARFVTVQLYTDILPIRSLTQEQRVEIAGKNALRLLDLAKAADNPTYAVLTPEGRLVSSKSGYVAPALFAQFLSDALAKSAGQTKVAQIGG